MWFSTCVRLVIIVESEGAGPFVDCVFVFEASGWDEARVAALRLGRSKESEYRNGVGQRVRWALVDVVTLDELGALERGGVEVYSIASDADVDASSITIDSNFRPEMSEPGSSGVPAATDEDADHQNKLQA